MPSLSTVLVAVGVGSQVIIWTLLYQQVRGLRRDMQALWGPARG